MSTRANIAAAAASLGVLALGWNLGTANSQTVMPTVPAGGTSAAGTSATGTSATGTGATSSSNGQSSTQTPQNSASTTTSAQKRTGLADGTFTGIAVSHRYGSVQVSVTISSGTITALNPTVTTDGEHKSEMINSRAIPTLEAEIVAANSALVNTISGATYTSSAYLESLQSALDQAN